MSDLSVEYLQGIRSGFNKAGPGHITILLATYNGANMLSAQLNSLARQTHKDWSLIVSDDGSTDATLQVVRDFAARLPNKRIVTIRGPRRGSAQNFLSLLRAAGNTPFVAFCDQDDVWFDDKLARAIATLTGIDRAAIYGSATLLTDQNLNPLRFSPQFRFGTGFKNALVQNVAGGNTMVVNRSALDVLQPASLLAGEIVAHDWWSYQMVTGIGGKMIFDPAPSLFYRQHDQNQIGANDTLMAQVRRLRRLISGEFSEWMDAHCAALRAAEKWLSPQAVETLSTYSKIKKRSPHLRVIALKDSGLYRQTRRGSLALSLAALLGRL